MLKKLLCSISAIIIFSSTAYAENIIEKIECAPLPSTIIASEGTMIETTKDESIADIAAINLFSNPDIPIDELIAKKIRLREEEIDISCYNLTLSEITNIYFDIIFSDCMLPVAPRFSYVNSGDIITHIAPGYLFDSTAEDGKAYQELDLLIKEICNYANAGITPLEKLLFAYQKIIYECDYDPNPYIDDDGNKHFETISHTAYGFTKNGYAVCQGYSILFGEVLERLGIESTIVICQTGINHMWNYVKLGESWYHADVTNGKMYHNPNDEDNKEIARGYNYMGYFLRSDSIENHGEKQYWNVFNGGSLPECNSTEFENGYMFNNNQMMIYRQNGKLYFDVYANTGDGIVAIPFISPKIKASTFFSETNPDADNKFDRYMFSLVSRENSNLFLAKYDGKRMYDCIHSKFSVLPTTLYRLQEDATLPTGDKSTKFMLWDTDISTPIADFAEAAE